MRTSIYSFTIFLVLFTISCSTSYYDAPLINEDYMLHGPVKSIEQISYELNDNGKKGERRTHYSFDNEYLRDQRVNFNMKGQVTTRKETNSEPKYENEYNYFYNNDKISKVENFQNGELIERIISKYYNNGKLKEVICYYRPNNENDIHYKKTFKYLNQNGNVKTISTITNYFEGSNTKKYQISDNKNREIESGFYDKPGNITSKYLYFYEGDNLTKMTYSGVIKYESGLSYNDEWTEEYRYDENGNLIEKSRIKDGETSTINYKYDELGNLIDNDEYQFKYKYDKYKNWTEKIYILEGKSAYITERNITYFSENEIATTESQNATNEENIIEDNTTALQFNQPSIKDILEINLRDIQSMKSTFGEPYFDEGDVLGWKFDDLHIEYQSEIPAILVKYLNKKEKYKTELNSLISLNTGAIYYFYDRKAIIPQYDGFQMMYISTYQQRRKNR